MGYKPAFLSWSRVRLRIGLGDKLAPVQGIHYAFFRIFNDMGLWSVNKALTVGWILIIAVVVASMTLAISLFALSYKLGWPLYISISIGIVLPVTAMIFGFRYTGKLWVPWIYMRVADVVEFQQAAQLSGFLAYPVDDIKDEHKRTLIEDRFKNYRFEDDVTVPYETVIYFRKPYQNLFFLIMFGGFILSFIPFIMFPSFGPQLIIPVFFGAAMIVTFYRSSDRSPQLAVSEKGIDTQGILRKWEEISYYNITQGKTSHLNFKHNGISEAVALDNLMVRNRRLNQLLHVYRNRSKLSNR